MLYLIQSNQMEALSEQLAKFLAKPDPAMPILMPEQVLVQSPGMSTWLRLEIAKYNQISALVDFPLPSSFIWHLCHTLLSDVPQENAFTKQAMTWKLMDLLPNLLDDPAFAPLAQYLEDEAPLKLFQLCGQIADIYDQYLVYRPDWISAWEANEAPIKLDESQRWQPILWRALIDFNVNELGLSHYHRANLHQALFDALDDPNTSLSKLPKRLFVFGISSMAPQTLEVIYHLAKRIDVVMLNLSPCQHYWGDIVDPKLRARMALEYANKNQLVEQWEDKLEVGNSLLANNGKMGRELLDLILGLPEEHTNFNFECYRDPQTNTVLAGIQHDILNLQTREQSLGPDASLYQSVQGRRVLAPNDDSVTFRRCHSPLREIETLHDHLLEMLARDPSLSPKDIVVMMPDVAGYAPYIDAVFASQKGAHFIPYAIADRGAAQESPLISSFLQLLMLNQSRYALTDIISILEVPAVLRKFDLAPEELILIRQWLEQAGVRWGRDGQSRVKHDLPAFDQNTWSEGIKRLILGYAFSDDAPLYHGTLGVNGIEGQAAQALGKLLNFIEVLDESQQALLALCPADERIEQINNLLNAFYDVDDDEREALQTVREALTQLDKELTDAKHQTPLSIDVLQNWFNRTLSESRVGQRYLAGNVNFCTLMPMRSIPFKVVCLLGMNDGVYPRVQHPIGFDLVAHFGARKGDRSRRLDDRYLFLEALLSARQQLYISYIGQSERDNSERIPSMLVSELLEYCQLCYQPQALMNIVDELTSDAENRTQAIATIEQSIEQQLVMNMPLQPFDARLYQDLGSASSNSMPLQQSYSAQWCPKPFENAGQFVDANQPMPLEEVDIESLQAHLEVSSLIRFYRNPAQYFLNRRLKVDLKLDLQADDNDEPFTLDALARYKLQANLLSDTLKKTRTSPDPQLLDTVKASGRLPLAPFNNVLLEKYNKDLAPLLSRLIYLQGEKSQQIDVNLTFSLPGAQPIELQGRIDDVSAKGLINYRPGSANGRDIIRVYLRHLCINAMGEHKASYLLDVGHFHQFVPISAEQAYQQLSLWLTYYIQGLTQPLHFMPQTSLAYAETDGDHQDKLIAAEAKWLDEARGFGEGNEPHFARLFEFPDDFTQVQFGEIAHLLLTPLLSLSQKQPLAKLESVINQEMK